MCRARHIVHRHHCNPRATRHTRTRKHTHTHCVAHVARTIAWQYAESASQWFVNFSLAIEAKDGRRLNYRLSRQPSNGRDISTLISDLAFTEDQTNSYAPGVRALVCVVVCGSEAKDVRWCVLA